MVREEYTLSASLHVPLPDRTAVGQDRGGGDGGGDGGAEVPTAGGGKVSVTANPVFS